MRLGWGAPVPAGCSWDQASGSTCLGSRFQLGDWSCWLRHMAVAEGSHCLNDVLQGYQTYCHSDSYCSPVWSLLTGVCLGMGCLVSAILSVCITCERVKEWNLFVLTGISIIRFYRPIFKSSVYFWTETYSLLPSNTTYIKKTTVLL